ncbi:7992_t:CDS:2 [Dentiscutata erythropus]|uniref:7992_t:CDS:1 n=1 Tax=Dentiscutata erythropus TaxID=1348616 RepID=A0A9N9A215_9GLOM|nr:7992_t:CDS:2 [Dentiscutata erythropus]
MPVKNWKKKVFEAFKLFSPSNKANQIDDQGCWSSSESESSSLSVISSRSRLSVISNRSRLSVISNRSRLSVISSRSRRSSFNRSINSFHEETEFSECSIDFAGLYKCPKCGRPGLQQDWCRKCESRKFKKLPKWTSGNEYLDKLIKSRTRCDYAIRIYGISREPETNSYIIVMPYYHKGDLRTILRERKTDLTWQEKFQILYSLSDALKDIHLKDHTHCNLHPGNIFQVSQDSSVRIIIGDLGMNKSAYEQLSSISESSDEEVNVHPEAIYSSRPLSGIITQGYGLESTLPQDSSRKSIVFKNSEIQDMDKIKEVIPEKRHSNLALEKATQRLSTSNNDIPTIEIHKYDSEPSDEEKD